MSADNAGRSLVNMSFIIGDCSRSPLLTIPWYRFEESGAAIQLRVSKMRAQFRDIIDNRASAGARKVNLPDDYWELACRILLDAVEMNGRRLSEPYVESVKDALALAVSCAVPDVREFDHGIVHIQRSAEAYVYWFKGTRSVGSKKLGALKHADLIATAAAAPTPLATEVRRHTFSPATFMIHAMAFVAGFVAVAIALVTFLLLVGNALDRQLIPRGPGWLVMPVLGGILCATIVPRTWSQAMGTLAPLRTRLLGLSFFARSSIVGTIAWLTLLGAYSVIFEPLGTRVSDAEFESAIKLMLLPPIVGVFLMWLVLTFLGQTK